MRKEEQDSELSRKEGKGHKIVRENSRVGAYRVIYDFGDGNAAESWLDRVKAARVWEWFESEDQDLGSFCLIFDTLDLNAATIRRRLKRYQDKRSERRRHARFNCNEVKIVSRFFKEL